MKRKVAMVIWKEKMYFRGIKLLLAEGYPAYPAHLVFFFYPVKSSLK